MLWEKIIPALMMLSLSLSVNVLKYLLTNITDVNQNGKLIAYIALIYLIYTYCQRQPLWGTHVRMAKCHYKIN